MYRMNMSLSDNIRKIFNEQQEEGSKRSKSYIKVLNSRNGASKDGNLGRMNEVSTKLIDTYLIW